MADNLAYTPGSGATVATDDVGGIQFQRVKMAFGADGINDGDARTPTTFKTATATASGDTALWTPTSGKKFRLMGYVIYVTADSSITAAAAVVDIVLRDSTTGLAAAFSQYVPGTAATTFGNSGASGWIDLGNGILSASANNVLNINLSGTLSTGKVRVVACGTEE